MNLLALADDVTGALEVGALLRAPVFLDADAEPSGFGVIDTETRHLAPAEASLKFCIASATSSPTFCTRRPTQPCAATSGLNSRLSLTPIPIVN